MAESTVTPETPETLESLEPLEDRTQEAEPSEATEAVALASATTGYPVVAQVNVRSGPGTSYRKVGTVSAGSLVAISCQTPGQNIVGPLGTSNIWDRIGSGRYVSDTYVRTGSDGFVAPRC
ncbi:SH3 domain-containing protein [Streptomyces sp. TS71-3]|uniref:SH3 domain-containing protein n=1 Tax=Streptomyces sp. TS71-3 TaxID=2733862 RepID=UPI001B0A7DD6|nr:SH3 domain-containing protein [Streptomyces sp. TS71-3]GHJ34727.1 hypothetical protein Sm713_03360 [Streptomyces sp. TS71-3]